MTIAVFLSSLLGAMALGMPIAFALLVCGVALMYQLDMMDAQIIAQNLINGADSFPLMAAPFFLLAGEIMNTGGLSKRIVNVALTLVGHVRGGLGYVVILASCILAALSGSAVADAAALSALLFPMMVQGRPRPGEVGRADRRRRDHRPDHPAVDRLHRLRRRRGPVDLEAVPRRHRPGHPDRRRASRSRGGGRRGRRPIVPPPKATPREVVHAVIDGAWALALPGIIIFGLKFGIFTPTEAGRRVRRLLAVRRDRSSTSELKWTDLYPVFVTAAETTAVVMFLVAAALVSAWLITVAELPGQVTALLKPFMDSPHAAA